MKKMPAHLLSDPPASATRGLIPPTRVHLSDGFTMLEVAAVMVILAVLASVAVARMMDNSAEVRQAAETLKVHLRQAQFRAMYSDTTWGIRCDGAKYWLFSDGNTANRAMFLGQNSDTVNLPSGVSCGSFTVSFDDWGVPYNGADPQTAGELASCMSMAVGSGSNQVSVSIEPNTGFIQ